MGSVRLLAVLLLGLCLLSPDASRADGLAYGKGFERLNETDQVAVVDMQPDAVNVDMFIAIEGIPKGQTVTYILPFWHKPEGFTLEEMQGPAFRDKCIIPARDLALAEQERSSSRTKARFLNAAIMYNLPLFGPLAPFGAMLAPTLWEAHSKGRADASSSLSAQGKLTPYTTITSPHARAELYRVDGEDLQQLLATAGLPEEYLQPLHKYHTTHYAIMRLTGTGASKNTRTWDYAPQGVHYHFRHPMPRTAGYTYTYPLGTGAAWPHPIALTEVYVTCPRDRYLDVTAPSIGEDRPSYGGLVNEARYVRIAGAQATSPTPPATSSLIRNPTKTPFAWHRAYLMSNPSQDVVVHLRPRPRAEAFLVALRLRDLASQPAVPVAMMLLAWVSAVLLGLRTVWVRRGRPGKLWRHTLRFLGAVVLSGALACAPWLVVSLGYHHAWSPAILLTVFTLAAVASPVAGPLVIAQRGPRITRAGWMRLGLLAGITVMFILLAYVMLSVFPGYSDNLLLATAYFVGAMMGVLAMWTVAARRVDGDLPTGTLVFTWFLAIGLYALMTTGVLQAMAWADRVLAG